MEQYSVVLSGFARGEEFFRGRMMKQGMKVAQIERVISAVPCVLKQALSFEDAKNVEELFRDAGAIVQLRREGDPAAEDITYEPPVSAPAPAPRKSSST